MPDTRKYSEEDLHSLSSQLALQYMQTYFENWVKTPAHYAERYVTTKKEIYDWLKNSENQE